MVDGRLAVDWFNRLVGWLVDCSPCGGGVSLSKPTKRENRLCDCCYSGKGAAIVVWNLIGICERAAPRHRRWQEMREAEQKAWCVQGEAAYIIVFDTRQEQEGQKARRKKEGTAPTQIKTPTPRVHPNPSRRLARITCPPNPFHPAPWLYDTSHEWHTIAKGPLIGPTAF